MHIAKRLVPFLTFILAFVVSTSPAQAVSGGDWMAPLKNVLWECSLQSNPRLRFASDKIETLDAGGKIISTMNKVSELEPGILRVDFNRGALMLFIFAEDMQSFVFAHMKSIHEFDLEGATGPSLLPTAPALIHLKDHPDWKTARVQSDKLELLDGSGNAYATNQAVPFTSRVLGVRLPSRGKGAVLMSRVKPGGWYLGGYSIWAPA